MTDDEIIEIIQDYKKQHLQTLIKGLSKRSILLSLLSDIGLLPEEIEALEYNIPWKEIYKKYNDLEVIINHFNMVEKRINE